MIETVRMGERKENVTTYKQESIWKWKKGSEWVKSRVCKKPKNRKNRFKLTEPMQKFRYGFGSVRFGFGFII